MQVVSGLGREIPSPNGGAVKGAIQTDAAINAGKFIVVDFVSNFITGVTFLFLYDFKAVLYISFSYIDHPC